MSDESVINSVNISQSNRYYNYYSKDDNIDKDVITKNSLNMHIIPSNDVIESFLNEVKIGNVVRISGNLVDVHGPGNWEWKTSVKRDDKGDGSSEIVWVENILS